MAYQRREDAKKTKFNKSKLDALNTLHTNLTYNNHELIKGE